MTDTKELEFRERRRQGIGGSDAAAVIGVDPYKDALTIYRQKIGELDSSADTRDTLRGRYLEPVAVQLYHEKTGRKLRRQPQRTHKAFPFVIGNVDRQIVDAEPGPGVLEVKCPKLQVFTRVKLKGLPIQYIVQMQHYLGVYGYKWGSFALFNADLWEMIHFDIAADPDFQATLFEAEARFWNEHVVRHVEPTTEVGPKIDLSALPAIDGTLVTRDDMEWGAAAQSLREAKALMETLEGLEADAKERLKALMGGYGAAEGYGLRVYWKAREGRRTFDRKLLEASRPLDPNVVWQILRTELTDVNADRLATLEKLIAANATLRLDAFEKQGQAFEEFRSYNVAPDRED